MPEIWLGYGSSHVVLDIKQENLLEFTPQLNIMSDENIRNILTTIQVSKKILIFPLSSSKHLLKIVSLLIEFIKPDDAIEIGSFSTHFLSIKSRFVQNKILQIDKNNFNEIITKFDHIIFISNIGYDPLFGFNIIPSIITRNFSNEIMTDILWSNEIIRPLPGQIDEPLKMALEHYDKLNIHSLEVLSNQHGISNLYYGDNSKFYKDILPDFKSHTIFNIDEQKSLIVSAGPELDNHLTLNNSLYSLWNCIGILKTRGTAVLLAENSDGLGEGALTMYLEGRLDLSKIKKSNYINGLEHLLYIENLKGDYNLGLVSSIPFYYAKTKFGLNTYDNIKNVLENLLSHYGKSNKVMICAEPSKSLFIKK